MDQTKKKKGIGRIAFLALRSEIADKIKKGWNHRLIYETHAAELKIGYRQTTDYIRRFCADELEQMRQFDRQYVARESPIANPTKRTEGPSRPTPTPENDPVVPPKRRGFEWNPPTGGTDMKDFV